MDSHLSAVPEILAVIPIDDPAEPRRCARPPVAGSTSGSRRPCCARSLGRRPHLRITQPLRQGQSWVLPDDLNGHRAGFPAVSPPPPPPAPVMVASADPAVPAGGPASRRSNGRAIGRSAPPPPGTSEGGRRFHTPTTTGPCAAHRSARVAGTGGSAAGSPGSIVSRGRGAAGDVVRI